MSSEYHLFLLVGFRSEPLEGLLEQVGLCSIALECKQIVLILLYVKRNCPWRQCLSADNEILRHIFFTVGSVACVLRPVTQVLYCFEPIDLDPILPGPRRERRLGTLHFKPAFVKGTAEDGSPVVDHDVVEHIGPSQNKWRTAGL